MASSLVIQTSFLGDAVLTTPLLAQLARRGPVDIVTTPHSALLLANHPGLRRVFSYDKRGADRGLRGFLSLARRLRAERYDVAFLAQGSWRSAALALFAGIPSRIGFTTSSGKWLLTNRVEPQKDQHHAARLLLLARPHGREPTAAEVAPSLHPGVAERTAVDALLTEAGVAPHETLVALAPSSLWVTKRWPYYAELAAELGSAVRIIVIGSGDDTALAQEILGTAPRAVDTTGRLSPLASAELIRRCAVIVTNDSAPLHLASAVGTPTVAIFGPTVLSFGFGPLAPGSIVASNETLTCRPCARNVPRECPLGHFRCMRDQSAASIAAHVRSILSSA